MNLNDVSEIDTTGLGTLLFALAKLRKAGGGLALVNLKPSHIKVLLEARVANVFEVFKTDQDAINSFFPGREFQRYDILEFVQSQQKPAIEKRGQACFTFLSHRSQQRSDGRGYRHG